MAAFGDSPAAELEPAARAELKDVLDAELVEDHDGSTGLLARARPREQLPVRLRSATSSHSVQSADSSAADDGNEIGRLCGALDGLRTQDMLDDNSEWQPNTHAFENSISGDATDGTRAQKPIDRFVTVSDDIHRSTFNYGRNAPEIAIHFGWIWRTKT